MNRATRCIYFAASLALILPVTTLADTPDQAEFMAQMIDKHGFQQSDLDAWLGRAERRQDILDAISRPAEGLPWWKYRKIFLTPQRVGAGVTYWQQNAETLAKAEAEYGVPPEIIVAIIGVETFYGRQTGKYPVLDALYTLGFYYPPRGAFFQRQLGEFLLLAREEHMVPIEPKGSYAGAMGTPQFIPSSFRAYAVDFDGDGRRDIWRNDADAIGSVANYFARHGWEKGEPVAVRAEGIDAKHAHFVDAGMKPTLTIGKLRKAGVKIDPQLPATAETNLIELDVSDAEREHWAGLKNFYVITRYNHSNLYAMAVYLLSRETKAAYSQQQKQ